MQNFIPDFSAQIMKIGKYFLSHLENRNQLNWISTLVFINGALT